MQTFKIRRFRDRDLSLTFDQTVKIQKFEAFWISPPCSKFSELHSVFWANLRETKMKLSTAVLAASAVEADFPWSACYQNGNPEICAKSCQSKMLWRAFKRDMYGSDSWVYKVMGTEKLDKTEAKASYRNVAHFDEKTCTTETLTTLYQALRQSSQQFR